MIHIYIYTYVCCCFCLGVSYVPCRTYEGSNGQKTRQRQQHAERQQGRRPLRPQLVQYLGVEAAGEASGPAGANWVSSRPIKLW